jgi:antitoxin MazE
MTERHRGVAWQNEPSGAAAVWILRIFKPKKLAYRQNVSTLHNGNVSMRPATGRWHFRNGATSLALRVPNGVAQEIGASDGKIAEMSVRDGKLVIEVTKPKPRKRRYTLDELVAGITPENRHEEIDWGPPVGNEVW